MKKEPIDMAHARLYVTTERIYASGDLFGQWMELRGYTDKKAFMAAFRKLYTVEETPVLKILDWQDVPGCLVSAADVSARVFPLSRYASGLDSFRSGAFHLWLEYHSPGIFTSRSAAIIRLFEESYQGYYPTDEAFGRYYAGEFLAITAPGFDYKGFAVQLFPRRFMRLGQYVFSR
jgi:hypothetical protein